MVTNDKIQASIEKTIGNGVNEVFSSQDNIRDYIHTVSKFYLQNFYNQVLIWKQNRDAHYLAGVQAYKEAGRELCEGAKPVMVVYPMIYCDYRGEIRTDNGNPVIGEEGGYEYEEKATPKVFMEYKAEAVYDISDTRGDDIDGHPTGFNLNINSVKEYTGFTLETSAGEDFGLNKGLIKKNESGSGQIILKEGLTDQQRDKTLVELFIDEYIGRSEKINSGVFAGNDRAQKGFQALLKAVVLDRYELLTEDFSYITVMPLAKESYSVRETVLKNLTIFAQEAIAILSEYFLTFDEIALCNNFIKHKDLKGIILDIMDVYLWNEDKEP